MNKFENQRPGDDNPKPEKPGEPNPYPKPEKPEPK